MLKAKAVAKAAGYKRSILSKQYIENTWNYLSTYDGIKDDLHTLLRLQKIAKDQNRLYMV
jgi:hypothetical protein